MPNYKALVNDFTKVGAEQATEWLNEAFREKALKPNEFEFGKLFAECFGFQRYAECRAGEMAWNVMEAAGAVSTGAFTHISGAILLSAIRTGYEDEQFVFSTLIMDEPSKIIGPERVGDINPIGDEALVVPEATEYPLAGVSEEWLQLPEAQKRGLIVALTREAIFMDQTGKLLQQAGNVGFSLGLSKEKRLVDCVVDENGGAVSTPLGHRYCRQGTYIATYGNSSGSHNFDNLEESNTLVDWSDVDQAEALLNNMVHPATGEPIVLNAMHLVVTKQLERTALRIAGATEVRFTGSGRETQTLAPNPYSSKLQVVTSRHLASRMATDTTWYYGDLSKAFGYKQIAPLQTLQAPAMSHDEFHRDIVRQWRADEFGTPFTREPRAIVKSTVA